MNSHPVPTATFRRAPRSALRTERAPFSAFRFPAFRFSSPGFTLIELLVVISIIGVLAAMLLPAISRAKTQARVRVAKMEMGQLQSAIQNYQSAYNRYPVSREAMAAAGTNDFTFGANFGGVAIISSTTPGTTMGITNNSEIISILCDTESVVDTNNSAQIPTVNKGHVKNTSRTRFLNANIVSGWSQPGIGADGVYRDPWGQPYVITIDINNDEKAKDSFYCQHQVSQLPGHGQAGINGLFDTNPTDANGNADEYVINSPVVVWSAGPDKKIDPNSKATDGLNKDNVLSWKQ